MTSAPAEQPVTLESYGSETIRAGSKSFALASLLFGKTMQEDAHKLYAWCRYCDDVIDGQTLGGDAPDRALTTTEQQRRLAQLRTSTLNALSGDVTGQHAFDAFADIVVRHQIPAQYAMDLLTGFEMDAIGRQYTTLSDTLEYCYGVAGSVGLMMAIIMGVDAEDETTLDRACDLGLAFQLTNIARDVVDDARAGRVYLPWEIRSLHGIDGVEDILDPAKRSNLSRAIEHILTEADRYYASATQGVRHLPPRAGAAVVAARNIYRDIGALVRRRGDAAWDQRAYISTPRKLWLTVCGMVEGAPQGMLFKKNPGEPRRDLWSRPGDGLTINPADDHAGIL